MDGFKYISDIFTNHGVLKYIRKNRNDGKLDKYEACSDDLNLGVDLNRNYGYNFGSSNRGSSP